MNSDNIDGRSSSKVDKGTLAMNSDNREEGSSSNVDKGTLAMNSDNREEGSSNNEARGRYVTIGSQEHKEYNAHVLDVNKYNKAYNITHVEALRGEFNKHVTEMEKIAKHLKDINGKVVESTTLDSRGKALVQGKVVSRALMDRYNLLDESLLNRVGWVRVIRHNLPLPIQTELEKINDEIIKLQTENYKTIAHISSIEDEKQQNKEFFDIFNGYRNKVNKEILRLEYVCHEGYKNQVPALYKLKEFKQLINLDSPRVIKQLGDQDKILKKNISDIINEKKK
jgi:hypothetical protein